MRRTRSRFTLPGRAARRPLVHGLREHGGSLNPPVQLLLILRWSARASSVLVLGMIGAFLVGSGLEPGALTALEWILMLFLLWTLIGLIVAWRWPLWGGMLSLLGLVGFHVLEWTAAGRPPSGVFFPAMAVPGVLFLASASRRWRT